MNIIVVPAFNEQDSIQAVVKSVQEFAEVLVVDDCSKDETARLAKDAGAFVHSLSVNKGYDFALFEGIKMAIHKGAEFVVTMDADGQHLGSDVAKMFSELRSTKVDLILGVRPKFQRLAEFVFQRIFSFFMDWKDPLCGMKGYRVACLPRNLKIPSYPSIGTELAIWYLGKGHSYSQISIQVEQRLHGSPRFAGVIRANIRIFYALVLGLVHYSVYRMKRRQTISC